ncbi:hypothetical protein ASPTUDRAFT_49524 [Aspergillus tubingensis CBS 134.48]|uniref:Uncharacterized protein n=1 Tax=Aspergillus tubingensis (strain CBS 134.48) TaxID=767770 RepID=A0A1L9NKI6_ASPTC|nr:hypothetical protein ASPTUDRAFT_49524 [Aspergillus tubingensis CBS 134.48]
MPDRSMPSQMIDFLSQIFFSLGSGYYRYSFIHSSIYSVVICLADLIVLSFHNK